MSDKLTLIFELGSLRVYYTESPVYSNSTRKDVYWFDATDIKGHGPFDTVYAAMKHYQWMLGQRKLQTQNITLIPNISNNIIHLDFKSKKRL